MSMTHADILPSERSSSTSYSGFVDAFGGVATMVLAIIGLSGTIESLMLGIVTIIFGASLLIQGGAMLSEYASIIFPAGTAQTSADRFGGGTLSALFMAGAAGIVLGLLALLGIRPPILSSAAVIAFGAALVLSASSVMNLGRIRASAAMAGQSASAAHSGSEILASEMSSGSAGIQAFAGLAAIVLGILSITGTATVTLNLVALLVLGATLIMTGTTLSGVVMGFMRQTVRTRQ